MSKSKLSSAEQKAAELLLRQADEAIAKLKNAADLAQNVVASAKESSDRDFKLQAQLSNLEGITTAGFDGVNKHLEVLNHQVLDHSKIISKILAGDSFSQGQNDGKAKTWKVVVTILTLAISILALFAWGKL